MMGIISFRGSVLFFSWTLTLFSIAVSKKVHRPGGSRSEVAGSIYCERVKRLEEIIYFSKKNQDEHRRNFSEC